ncbi:metallophosphoesterase [Dactylosporangium sp. NPDC005572]|uniref:metallophosphoesterase family protein n=1 Tax=Dactylosporangium sp. NPDC005572 TaxID=3156889 RepID=UPI0033B69B87
MQSAAHADPQRVAFAGDWHANTRWAVTAIDYAKQQGADIIVHVGDFGYDFPATFLRNVTKALARAGLHLWFVDGNHEDFDLLSRYPIRGNGLREVTDRIWHIPRGHRWEWAGTSFLGCGGAHSVDRPWREPGVSWWRQETITEEDAARCVAGGPVDVLVAHDCPAGVMIPGVDDRDGPPPFPPLELQLANEHRQVLRRIVDALQPALIVHGHYHVLYTARPEFTNRPRVLGLDCDGTALERNVRVYELHEGWVARV